MRDDRANPMSGGLTTTTTTILTTIDIQQCGACCLIATLRKIVELQKVGEKRDVIFAVCGPKFTKFWRNVADPLWLKILFSLVHSTFRCKDIFA